MNDEQATRLAEYWAGEATDIEAGDVEKSLRNSPLYGELRRAWDSSTLPRHAGNAELFAARLDERVRAGLDTDSKAQAEERGGYSLGKVRRWVGSAVVAGILLFAMIGIEQLRTKSESSQSKTYITANAQRLRVTLPEGSLITLAPATKVRYTNRGNEWNIDVNGEAHFEVKHNSHSIFNVRASGIDTKVLGTQFTVRKYDSDGTVRVVVADGRVSVTRAGVLSAGDVAKVSLAGEVSIIRNTDVSLYTGWLEGKNSYVNIPLRELVPEIERTYDLSVTVSDPEIAELPVTITLATQATPNEILNAIASLLGARVTRTGPGGRNVTLSAH